MWAEVYMGLTPARLEKKKKEKSNLPGPNLSVDEMKTNLVHLTQSQSERVEWECRLLWRLTEREVDGDFMQRHKPEADVHFKEVTVFVSTQV